MRYRPIDCDISDLKGPEAEAVASRQAPPYVGDLERQAIEDALAGSGVTPEMLDNLEILIDRIAFARAGEALRHVVRCLKGSPAGVALERVLLGSEGRSLADDASTVKTSKQLIQYHEKTTRKRLSHLTPVPIKNDDEHDPGQNN